MQNIFLVSVGAVFGANTRFLIFNKLEKKNIRSDFSILIINSLASFSLGFFLSVLPRISSFELLDRLVLFFSIGYLGSFSTFSTFVYDLYQLLLNYKFYSSIKLFLFSSISGIIALAFGCLLGNL